MALLWSFVFVFFWVFLMDLLAAGCIIPRMGKVPITFIMIYYENYVNILFYLKLTYIMAPPIIFPHNFYHMNDKNYDE